MRVLHGDRLRLRLRLNFIHSSKTVTGYRCNKTGLGLGLIYFRAQQYICGTENILHSKEGELQYRGRLLYEGTERFRDSTYKFSEGQQTCMIIKCQQEVEKNNKEERTTVIANGDGKSINKK